MNKRPDWYMFERHSREEVAGWARQLHYFYFCRAWGGHANDGDAFKAKIYFTDKNDLESKLSMLGILIGTIGPDDQQPVVGQAYTGAAFAKFKRQISLFPDMEQPGLVTIAGQKVFVWVSNNTIDFSVAGLADDNVYEVSDADFKACLELEAIFDKLKWQPCKDASLEQSSSCISPSSYPEFY